MNLHVSAINICLAILIQIVPAAAQEQAIPWVALPPADSEGPMSSISPEPPQRVDDLVGSIFGIDGAIEVPLGQGRLVSLNKRLATEDQDGAVIAVGDPTVLDFEVIGLTRIRLIGLRIGTTDLSIIMADGMSRSLEVRVVADLRTLRAQLAASFPDSSVKVTQIADHIVLEGQARTATQVSQIHQTVEAWLTSLQNAQNSRVSGSNVNASGWQQAPSTSSEAQSNTDVVTKIEPSLQVSGNVTPGQVINLLTVPGSQQVMLKVQIAELNRTALRKLGASFLFKDGSSSVASNLASGAPGLPLFGGTSGAATIGGVIVDGSGSLAYAMDALRSNSVLKILAEPTLVSYSGHEATFLAGGEFPVPVPQGGAGIAGSGPTVQFKEFGVKLGFLPNILDGDRIRLTVTPEVSSIDRTLQATLVADGSPVPGLTTRRSTTTMELKPGQTLAMAGLLQVTLENNTNRIPGLGDLPVLGPFFSNNSGQRTEKELIVMVTPYLIEPVDECEIGMLPGTEINEPNDLEFYLLGRIEGRTGADFRSTTKWDDPCSLTKKLKLHSRYMCGPSGYSR